MQEEIIKDIKFWRKEIANFATMLNIKEKKEKIKEIQLKMSEPKFWENQTQSSKLVAQLKKLRDVVDSWEDINKQLDDIEELASFSDQDYNDEIIKEKEIIGKKIEQFRLKVLFNKELDQANAIMEINSGAGGTEACDWAQMLLRMYMRWAEDKGFRTKILNELKGEEVGYKNVIFLIEGDYAYGYLKNESGVHRLVRISPFDANKRRHTSFASVSVYPELENDINVEINPEDLRIDTFRAGGHGGQHVNVTDSAVRITHLPTGIVVSCQNERSQYQNKQRALAILKGKLYELEKQKRKEEIEKFSGQKLKIEWGSQIRSYVLCPYLLVKDHRTQIEEHDAWKVLDGYIDNFIVASLKQNQQNQNEED